MGGGPWSLGTLEGAGEGRVKVQMGGSAHTGRGSLALTLKCPPGANFYQRKPLGQGVGTHPALDHPLHGPQSSGGGVRGSGDALGRTPRGVQESPIT